MMPLACLTHTPLPFEMVKISLNGLRKLHTVGNSLFAGIHLGDPGSINTGNATAHVFSPPGPAGRERLWVSYGWRALWHGHLGRASHGLPARVLFKNHPKLTPYEERAIILPRRGLFPSARTGLWRSGGGRRRRPLDAAASSYPGRARRRPSRAPFSAHLEPRW